MGSFLDKPIVEKETLDGAGNNLVWGCSAMQGWRIEMEDAHTCESSITEQPDLAFFAVYDGHGGKTASTLSAVQLLPGIINGTTYQSGDKSAACLSAALYQGLLDQDQKMLDENPKLASCEDHSGSTCIASFISPTHIIVANCGDSRAVLARAGGVHFGSIDHKPTDAGETARIQGAGGFIEMGRVCGNLAVSRSLADFQYKDRADLPADKQKVTAASDMTTIARDASDEFLLLCCDGIWDVMSNEDAVEFVSTHLKAGVPAPIICERLLDHCLNKNSKDNMSACLVVLPGAPKAIEGYPVPAIASTVEDDERAAGEQQDAMALSKRLSTIMASMQQENG